MKQLKTVNNYVQYEDDCNNVLSGYALSDLIFQNVKNNIQFFGKNDVGHQKSIFSFALPFYLNEELITVDNYLEKLGALFTYSGGGGDVEAELKALEAKLDQDIVGSVVFNTDNGLKIIKKVINPITGDQEESVFTITNGAGVTFSFEEGRNDVNKLVISAPGGGSGYIIGSGLSLAEDGTLSVNETTIQHKLTAGANITIEGNVISSSGGGGGSYTAGNGLTLSGTQFSVDTSVIQPLLSAGTNITISNGTISSTDTKYSAGTGLTLSSGTFTPDLTVLQAKLSAGSGISIDINNNISATGIDIPDQFTSTQNGLGTVGSSNNYLTNAVAPIQIGIELGVGDTVYFQNNYQATVTLVNGANYSATTVFVPAGGLVPNNAFYSSQNGTGIVGASNSYVLANLTSPITTINATEGDIVYYLNNYIGVITGVTQSNYTAITVLVPPALPALPIYVKKIYAPTATSVVVVLSQTVTTTPSFVVFNPTTGANINYTISGSSDTYTLVVADSSNIGVTLVP